MSGKKTLAILISGRGSNMQALIEAAAAPDYPAKIVLVLSNVPGAPGLSHAAAAGLPVAAIDHRDFPARAGFDAALQARLDEAGVELIALAGFMRILTDNFVKRWEGRMLNIHPSLLPAFKGTHVHEQAIAAGVRQSGCTVHYVVPALDSGPIIAQEAVPVLPADTAETLAARVLDAEHRLYPKALKWVAEGKVALEGGRAVFAR